MSLSDTWDERLQPIYGHAYAGDPKGRVCAQFGFPWP